MPAARLVRRHASPSGSGTSCPTAKHASPGSVGKPPRLAAAVLVLRRRRHHALPCESGGTPHRVVASPSGGGTPCQAAAAATPRPAATVQRLARRRAGGGSCAILCRAPLAVAPRLARRLRRASPGDGATPAWRQHHSARCVAGSPRQAAALPPLALRFNASAAAPRLASGGTPLSWLFFAPVPEFRVLDTLPRLAHSLRSG